MTATIGPSALGSIGPATKVDWTSAGVQKPALIVLCAGFEERSQSLLAGLRDIELTGIILVRYSGAARENGEAFDRMIARLHRDHPKSETIVVDLNINDPRPFESALKSTLEGITIDDQGEIWVDISGLTMAGICMVMYACRSALPLHPLRVLYTEAKSYFPLKTEYQKWAASDRSAPDVLPESLTSEMSEVFLLDTFRGFSIRDAPTCLILFAGYENHRSAGVVEHINPNRLVLIYGTPPREELKWRMEMSKRLHANLVANRETAQEEVSTIDVGANVAGLYEYYDMLYDTHNVCISPHCGKLQTVAAYLLWERFRDIQLAFSLPVSYLPRRFSTGAGSTFSVVLPPTPAVEALFPRGNASS